MHPGRGALPERDCRLGKAAVWCEGKISGVDPRGPPGARRIGASGGSLPGRGSDHGSRLAVRRARLSRTPAVVSRACGQGHQTSDRGTAAYPREPLAGSLRGREHHAVLASWRVTDASAFGPVQPSAPGSLAGSTTRIAAPAARASHAREAAAASRGQLVVGSQAEPRGIRQQEA